VTAYVDASALLKRYVDEPDSARADSILGAAGELVTGRHTAVEVRRNLARLLGPAALADARASLLRDLESFHLVELDAATCELAATVAEQSGLRTLDALHLGAALRVGTAITFVTFDHRQAQAARDLGFTVAGA
jgi:uncharacterized protein